MKKKVIAGLLGTAMVASLLAGCGSSNNTTDTTADTAAATEAAADTTADTAAADAESEAQSVADAAGDVDLSNADVAVMYYTYGDTYIASVQHWMLNWTNWVLNIRTTMQTTTRQHRTSRSIQLSRQVQMY